MRFSADAHRGDDSGTPVADTPIRPGPVPATKDNDHTGETMKKLFSALALAGLVSFAACEASSEETVIEDPVLEDAAAPVVTEPLPPITPDTVMVDTMMVDTAAAMP
jgi:hypothetical protein